MSVNINELRIGQKLRLAENASHQARTNLTGEIVITDLGSIYIYVNGDTRSSTNGYGVSNFELVPEPRVDFTKPVETMDGEPVEIITLKGRSVEYPVMAYVGKETDVRSFTEDGLYHANKREHGLNLRNVREKRVAYLNMYPIIESRKSGAGLSHPSREVADREAGANRIGCIKIELVEGQYDA